MWQAALLMAAVAAHATEEPKVTFDPQKYLIWIPVQVNGGPPLNFALDSAAGSSAIDWDRAEELKIPFDELGLAHAGSGDNVARVGRTGAVRLTLPDATLDLPALGVVSLRGVSESYGRRMDGVIGAELLERYVVEIDWDARRLALHEPATYDYLGGGAALPLILAQRQPFVRMSVAVPGAAPVEGLFLVDCPHPGTIIMNTPFVQDHALLKTARRSLPRLVTAYAEGVGGKSEIQYGRISELRLGPFTLHEPWVGFSEAKAGSLAQSSFSGILGSEVLRRFRMIFDYRRERMILEPNAYFGKPFPYDASGLRLRATGEGLREYLVTGVVEDSPAEAAKLQAGDRLTEINGKPAGSLTLGAIVEMLRRDGEAVRLKVRRGTHAAEVALTLRRLI